MTPPVSLEAKRRIRFDPGARRICAGDPSLSLRMTDRDVQLEASNSGGRAREKSGHHQDHSLDAPDDSRFFLQPVGMTVREPLDAPVDSFGGYGRVAEARPLVQAAGDPHDIAKSCRHQQPGSSRAFLLVVAVNKDRGRGVGEKLG